MMVITSFISGFIMSMGLIISGMVDPAKVIGFLDVFGDFDPTLAFVMAGALLVTAIGYKWARCCAKPVFCECFDEPKNAKIDLPLLLGSALFGIGWGLAGFCPAPALVAVGLGAAKAPVFAAAMAAGMLAGRMLMEKRD